MASLCTVFALVRAEVEAAMKDERGRAGRARAAIRDWGGVAVEGLRVAVAVCHEVERLVIAVLVVVLLGLAALSLAEHHRAEPKAPVSEPRPSPERHGSEPFR
jgi:hypothetical protein